MTAKARQRPERTMEEMSEIAKHRKRLHEDKAYAKADALKRKQEKKDLKEFKAKLSEVKREQVLKVILQKAPFGSRKFKERTSKEWIDWAVETYQPDAVAPDGLSPKEAIQFWSSLPRKA